MNTRDQILLINLLINHIKSEKKEIKSAMVDQWDEFMYCRDTEETSNIAWGICNDFGDVIRLRADIVKLLQIRRELQ